MPLAAPVSKDFASYVLDARYAARLAKEKSKNGLTVLATNKRLNPSILTTINFIRNFELVRCGASDAFNV